MHRKELFPRNFQHGISGCTMFGERNGDGRNGELTQPRQIEHLAGDIVVERETRELPPAGVDLLDQYRMMVWHGEVGGYQTILSFVDGYDEASQYPRENNSDKNIAARIYMADGTYLRVMPQHEIKQISSYTTLDLVAPTAFKPTSLADSTYHYYDAFFNMGKNRVVFQLGKMFVPFLAKTGEVVVHPRTRKKHYVLEDAKGFHASTELTARNYSQPSLRIPHKAYSTDIYTQDNRRIIDKNTTNLAYQHFGIGTHSFGWDPVAGYVPLLDVTSEAAVTIRLSDRNMIVDRRSQPTVVIPTLCQLPLVPLQQRTTPQEFIFNFRRYIEDLVIPHLQVSEHAIDLSTLR